MKEFMGILIELNYHTKEPVAVSILEKKFLAKNIDEAQEYLQDKYYDEYGWDFLNYDVQAVYYPRFVSDID